VHPLVDLGMTLSFVAPREPAPAHVARERLFAGVGAQVRRQVVAAAERARAHLALERLLTRVDPHVTRQLVAAREAAFAERHRADVRPLGRGTDTDRRRRVSARPGDGKRCLCGTDDAARGTRTCLSRHR